MGVRLGLYKGSGKENGNYYIIWPACQKPNFKSEGPVNVTATHISNSNLHPYTSLESLGAL